jgi:carboxylesterase type B
MPQQKYPVYIFIHGGGYQEGEGTVAYNEIFKNFVSTGLIFVSINYRLNVFGELQNAFEDPTACKVSVNV